MAPWFAPLRSEGASKPHFLDDLRCISYRTIGRHGCRNI
jgi:hypothetical protein